MSLAVELITVTIALFALGLSWLNHRRLDAADKRVNWSPVATGGSVSLVNLGPGDARGVRITFPRGVPLSNGALQHPVVRSGATIWVAGFAPRSNYLPPDVIRVDWDGGPEDGWTTEVI